MGCRGGVLVIAISVVEGQGCAQNISSLHTCHVHVCFDVLLTLTRAPHTISSDSKIGCYMPGFTSLFSRKRLLGAALGQGASLVCEGDVRTRSLEV